MPNDKSGFLVREGFRSRLENIVRGQAGSQSDSTANNNVDDSRNDQTQTNALQDVQHENREQLQPPSQESDINRLSNQMGNSESNIAAERINLQETANQGANWQEPITEDGRTNWQQTTFGQFSEWRDVNTEDIDGNWRENSVGNWPEETPRNADREEGIAQEAQGVWQRDRTREGVGNWSEGPSGPLRNRRSVPFRRSNRFHPPDDDNVYSMELRELLSR